MYLLKKETSNGNVGRTSILWLALGTICLVCIADRATSAPINADAAGAARAGDARVQSRHLARMLPRVHAQTSRPISNKRNPALMPSHAIHQGAGNLSRVPMGAHGTATGIQVPGRPNFSKREATRTLASPGLARNSGIGGPRVQNTGRLGGPVVGRTVHSASIDGMQIRSKR